LNIGPDEKGLVPELVVERLEDMTEWMEVNGEAVYNISPYEGKQPQYSYYAQSGKNLYLYLPGETHSPKVLFYIDPSTVQHVSLLTKKGEISLDYEQSYGNGIIISLPGFMPFSSISVIKIQRKQN